MTKNSLLYVLAKEFASNEVQELVQFYSLTEIEDDPPFRRYVGSRNKGLDILTEDGRIIAIQVFAQASQGFSEFPDELPFGIGKHMSQEAVHQLLGPPLEFDEFDSKYELPDSNAKLSINFDKSLKITYLNIAVLDT